jgi:PAS domain S-box-containing protein
MPDPLQILIAEDNPADAKLIVRALHKAGFKFDHRVVDSEEAYRELLHPGLDIILSDFEIPQFGALRALEVLKERNLEIPFIIISGTIGEDLAVEVMKQGASDYLLKDRLGRLGNAVTQAIAQGRLREERRAAEAALRESEERFRDVVQNIEEVFWMTNAGKTEIFFVSTAYEKIWGRSCQSLYAAPLTWLEAVHPDDRERVRLAAFTQQHSGAYHEEYRILRPDGSIRWIRDRAFPVRGPDGAVLRLAGVAEDITARRRAQDELRLFRNLVDQSTDTFEVIDPVTGRFLDVNARGPADLGYTRAEYLAMRVVDINVDMDDFDWSKAAEEIRLAGSMRREGSHRRKDGTTFPIEINARWVHLDRDYIVAVVRDVSERQRAEERVLEQAAMLNLSHEAIVVCDIHTGRVTFWNQGAERLYGWPASLAEGRDLTCLIFADPKQPDVVTEVLLKTDEWRGEQRQVTKAGRELIVSSRVTLIRDSQGAPKSALVINSDITEQKNLESRFLRAQRMESIGTLASGVAHDLNNILAPIMMSVPVLRRALSPQARDEIITTIEMSANRGAQIVKQVLTFGSGLEGDRCPLDVEPLVKEVIKIMRETFPRNILIRSALEADLWPVLGDATQIHQVLLNLCVNARDAMPEGGELRLSARSLNLDASYASMLPDASPGPYTLIEASDTGYGIPPEIVERIFDPFFTTKGPGKGTGLGLSTTLGIVKSHGGFIQVKSQPGSGTTFQVYLPASMNRETAPGDIAPQAFDGHGELILVVDDEPGVRGAARLALESSGYRVLVAADGTEALAVFAMNSATIAVVLTDLMMPLMDGISLVRALRTMAPLVPIVASTGLGEKTQLSVLKALGVETVLHKPYSADTLLQTVYEALPSGSNPAQS